MKERTRERSTYLSSCGEVVWLLIFVCIVSLLLSCACAPSMSSHVHTWSQPPPIYPPTVYPPPIIPTSAPLITVPLPPPIPMIIPSQAPPPVPQEPAPAPAFTEKDALALLKKNGTFDKMRQQVKDQLQSSVCGVFFLSFSLFPLSSLFSFFVL